MLGALCRYVTEADARAFQPMKANLGILDPLDTHLRGRPERARAYADRSEAALEQTLAIAHE
jgi:methylenetetrahydrofolate--tRNA-(uracil-5-)-methyltransferase